MQNKHILLILMVLCLIIGGCANTAKEIENMETNNYDSFEDYSKLEELRKEGEELDRTITEQDERLAEQDKHLAEQDKHLAEQDKHLAEQDKEYVRIKIKFYNQAHGTNYKTEEYHNDEELRKEIDLFANLE